MPASSSHICAVVVVPFADAILAALAIELGVEIWTRDNHFRLIVEVLPLRLFDETGALGATKG